MKRLLPLFCALFLLMMCLACHENKNQAVVYDGATYLDFKLEFSTDTTSADNIDWKREHLVSEFTLKGKTPLHYSVTLPNDSIANLSKFYNNKWNFQETIFISGFTISRITDKHIISEFKITDFDHDGDEDLMVWVDTNMNGNEWTRIYLNDAAQNKLINLYDTADETAIWNRPKYNKTTGIINCTLDGSAYGASEESTYKLQNLTTIPLEKSRQERYKEPVINYEYIGENGKWKQVSKEINE